LGGTKREKEGEKKKKDRRITLETLTLGGEKREWQWKPTSIVTHVERGGKGEEKGGGKLVLAVVEG